MALPYATSALIRYVTDRVLENVTKQLAKPAPEPDVAALQAAAPDLAAIIGALNSNLLQLQREMVAIEEQMQRLDRRMTRLEKRWGWVAMARVVLAVVVAFVFGLIMWQMLRLGGWVH